MLIRLTVSHFISMSDKVGAYKLDLSIRMSVHTPVASYTCGLD